MKKNLFMSDEKLEDLFTGFFDTSTPKKQISKIEGNQIIIICPGFKQENINVEVDGNKLIIEGESEKFGTFKEGYQISRDVVGVNISVKDGILTATLKQKPSNVEIIFE